MRNLENFEIHSVGGAVIKCQGWAITVSSIGIPANEFSIIDKNMELFLNGKISQDDAAYAILKAGVSENSINTYFKNWDSFTMTRCS